MELPLTRLDVPVPSGAPSRLARRWESRGSGAAAGQSKRAGGGGASWRKSSRRAAGDPGWEGVALNLASEGTTPRECIFTVPVTIGGREFPLLVDTGSSDLWVASTSCTNSQCKSSNVKLYNPSSSSTKTNTNGGFSMQYLRGSASGPIYLDDTSLGEYQVPQQAFAAVDTLSDENLSVGFSGILGLGLPANSVITSSLPPVVDIPGTAPYLGGAYFNRLLGIDDRTVDPNLSGPQDKFFSILLERPDDPRTESVLAVGKHPDKITAEQVSEVVYSSVLAPSGAQTLWRLNLVSVTANGAVIPVGSSNAIPTNQYPVAVLDTGGTEMFGPASVLNAIFGVIGEGPGSDGGYYLNCDTPLSITLTFDNSVSIPIHPLDISYPVSSANDPIGKRCISTLQAAPVLGDFGDWVLGASFLRNAYTVHSYEQNVLSSNLMPQVGLLPLITNTSQAVEEFIRVRQQRLPIVDGAPSPTSGSNTNGGGSHGKSLQDKTHLAIPLPAVVVLAVVGFFVLAASAFAARYFFLRRSVRRLSKDGSAVSTLTYYDLSAASQSEKERQRKLFEAKVGRPPSANTFGDEDNEEVILAEGLIREPAGRLRRGDSDDDGDGEVDTPSAHHLLFHDVPSASASDDTPPETPIRMRRLDNTVRLVPPDEGARHAGPESPNSDIAEGGHF